MAGSTKSIQTNRGGMVVAKLRGDLCKPTVQKNSRYYFSICSLSGTTRQEETASKKNITNQGWFIRPRQAYFRPSRPATKHETNPRAIEPSASKAGLKMPTFTPTA
jgi:hypothetical protein